MDVIFWEDVYHKINVSVKLFGNVYTIAYNIDNKFSISDEEVYEILTDIMYMDEEILIEEGGWEIVPEIKFLPHKVINTDRLNAMYYNNQEITNTLCNVIKH